MLQGGTGLKDTVVAALSLFVILGIAGAQTFPPTTYLDPNTDMERNVTFSFEQSVQGNGYFMTYKYARAGNLEFKDYAHGSGAIDSEAILSTYELNHTTHMPDQDWNDLNEACIQYKESSSMTYAPTDIAIGTGYYSANPLRYDSLLKEKTWIKNKRASTSMHHEVEYAHEISPKDLFVLAKEKTNVTYDPIFEGVGVTEMKIREDVTDGKIHIGVLQGSVDSVSTYPTTLTTAPMSNWMAWKKPAIEIDEDYFGTYHIEKNMSIEVPYKKVITEYDWLPCCAGGWDDMYSWDQKGHGASTKGIFDCSCYKAPSEAQFQRE